MPLRKTTVHRTLIAAAAAALPAAALTVWTTTAQAAGSAFPAHYSAPYLQINSADAGDMAADKSASGDKYYTLAFLTPKSGCTPMWEYNNDPVGSFKSQISSLQSAGGNVIVSFGGASGGELAQTCTSVSSLTAAYANVVDTYGVTRLDFDIEGSVLADTASNSRRDQALAALQVQNPNVQIDFTLPVDPTGLPSSAMTMLRDAKSKGVKVNLVNIMTMDFGDGQNALADAESAANGTEPQLASLYGVSAAQAWHLIGLTPIAGKNDDDEVFSQSNASTLESFAASKGVQELAFWEVDGYDKPLNYAYSKIFQKITGGTTPPPGSGITNGGFETGDFTGWTRSGTTSIVSSPVHGGTHAARLGSTTPTNGDSTVSQTFTAPSGSSKVSVWYDMTCPDDVTYDWATVTLKDNTAGTTATVMGKTCTLNAGWKQLTASVTAGHSYTLTLLSHDENNPGDATYTVYDDTTVS